MNCFIVASPDVGEFLSNTTTVAFDHIITIELLYQALTLYLLVYMYFYLNMTVCLLNIADFLSLVTQMFMVF